MIRKWLKISEAGRITAILQCLSSAGMDIQQPNQRRKTDLIGIACQYGGAYGMRRSDIEEMKNMTLGQIIERLES